MDLNNDYDFLERKEKILRINRDEALRLLWDWIKKEIISFKVFKELLKFVSPEDD